MVTVRSLSPLTGGQLKRTTGFSLVLPYRTPQDWANRETPQSTNGESPDQTQTLEIRELFRILPVGT